MIRTRGFEKVSYEEWKSSTDTLYSCRHNSLVLPRRATEKSSGYDIYSPICFSLLPGESIVIPAGFKSYMLDDEELKIYPRSSVGFKHKIWLANTVGKIDSDYYNNIANEGHIMIMFVNAGNTRWNVKIEDRIAQATFSKYLITDDDDPINKNRIGGIGSTNK